MIFTISIFTLLIGLSRLSALANWWGVPWWPPMDSLMIIFVMGGRYLETLWTIVQISLRFTDSRHSFVLVFQIINMDIAAATDLIAVQ
jgi:hypothetical protein